MLKLFVTNVHLECTNVHTTYVHLESFHTQHWALSVNSLDELIPTEVFIHNPNSIKTLVASITYLHTKLKIMLSILNDVNSPQIILSHFYEQFDKSQPHIHSHPDIFQELTK